MFSLMKVDLAFPSLPRRYTVLYCTALYLNMFSFMKVDVTFPSFSRRWMWLPHLTILYYTMLYYTILYYTIPSSILYNAFLNYTTF